MKIHLPIVVGVVGDAVAAVAGAAVAGVVAAGVVAGAAVADRPHHPWRDNVAIVGQLDHRTFGELARRSDRFCPRKPVVRRYTSRLAGLERSTGALRSSTRTHPA